MGSKKRACVLELAKRGKLRGSGLFLKYFTLSNLSSARIEVQRLVAGRGPLVFRICSALVLSVEWKSVEWKS